MMTMMAPTVREGGDHSLCLPCLMRTDGDGSKMTLLSSPQGETRQRSPLLLESSTTDSNANSTDEKTQVPQGGDENHINPPVRDATGCKKQKSSGQPRSGAATMRHYPFEVVMCAEHQKERTVQNMMRTLNSSWGVQWVCRPDVPCKMRKDGRIISHASRREQLSANGFPCVAPATTTTTGTTIVAPMQPPQVVFTAPNMNSYSTLPSGVSGYCIGNYDGFVPQSFVFTTPPPNIIHSPFMQPTAHRESIVWAPVQAPPPPLYSPVSAAVGGVPFASIVPHVSMPTNFG